MPSKFALTLKRYILEASTSAGARYGCQGQGNTRVWQDFFGLTARATWGLGGSTKGRGLGTELLQTLGCVWNPRSSYVGSGAS